MDVLEVACDDAGHLPTKSRRHSVSSSMYIYYRTSLLTSRAQTLVNTVNCVGVMGKGIALAFKKRYPKMYKEYVEICNSGLLKPGGLWMWHGPDHNVLNFATKNHWRQPSRLEWIEAGLRKFQLEYERLGITEISFPRLGCGNGGLDWDEVRPLMQRYLTNLPISVYVHDFEFDIGLPEHIEHSRQEVSAAEVSGSFDGFLAALHRVLDVHRGVFVDIVSKERFSARFDGSAIALTIESPQGRDIVDYDDLRALWIAALGGLVTKEKIGAADVSSIDHLMSILAFFPRARLVQIKRLGNHEPELAVEISLNRGAKALF